jgi:hypothetical protein
MIGDQDIEPAEFLNAGLDELFRGGRSVQSRRRCRTESFPTLASKLFGCRLGLFIIKEDPAPSPDEQADCGCANSARTARDERDFAVE